MNKRCKIWSLIGFVCLLISYILYSIIIISTEVSPPVISLLKFNIAIFFPLGILIFIGIFSKLAS